MVVWWEFGCYYVIIITWDEEYREEEAPTKRLPTSGRYSITLRQRLYELNEVHKSYYFFSFLKKKNEEKKQLIKWVNRKRRRRKKKDNLFIFLLCVYYIICIILSGQSFSFITLLSVSGGAIELKRSTCIASSLFFPFFKYRE